MRQYLVNYERQIRTVPSCLIALINRVFFFTKRYSWVLHTYPAESANDALIMHPVFRGGI